MKFVTFYETLQDKLYINTELITAVLGDQCSCDIHTVDGKCYHILEDILSVMQKIKAIQNMEG